MILCPKSCVFFGFTTSCLVSTSCTLKISEALHNIGFLGAEVQPYIRVDNIISKNNNTQTHMEWDMVPYWFDVMVLNSII